MRQPGGNAERDQLLQENADLRTIAAEALRLGRHRRVCKSHTEICVDCGHYAHQYAGKHWGPTSGWVVCACVTTDTKPLDCTCKFGPLVAKAKAAGVEV